MPPLQPRVADSLFKAYDIRGVVGETLTPDAVQAIGRAFGDRMREEGVPRIVTGRDGRLSSPALQSALNAGLMRAGVDVVDIGLCTSPMLYFATVHLQTGAGVQVTGSHNPPSYNGLKLMAHGAALHGEAVRALRHRIGVPGFDAQASVSPGWLQQDDIHVAYQAHIVRDIHLQRRMRIVIDAGNGVAGAYAGAIFRAIGCEVTELFCAVDGHFPHHHPDPSRAENLRDLQACLAAGDAEVGLAFDGDADRLGVVTRDGCIIDADRLLMLFAPDVLAHQPGAAVVFDVKCSRHLATAIATAGGQPDMWCTGHSLLKARMRELGAALAGEMSGHLFFADRWYGFDDGIYAGARLLEILSRHADPSGVLNALPRSVSTPEIQVPMPDGHAHAFVQRFCSAVCAEGSSLFTVPFTAITVDGVRLEFEDGFGLIRASNTTPVLTLRFEADTEAALRRLQARFKAALLAMDPALRWPF